MTEIEKQANEIATELLSDIIHMRSKKMSDGSRIELPTAIVIAKYIANKIKDECKPPVAEYLWSRKHDLWTEVENQLNDM
jgi:hypothetical protein